METGIKSGGTAGLAAGVAGFEMEARRVEAMERRLLAVEGAGLAADFFAWYQKRVQ